MLLPRSSSSVAEKSPLASLRTATQTLFEVVQELDQWS